jgi:UDP-N-acetylmuramate dehydrogenase
VTAPLEQARELLGPLAEEAVPLGPFTTYKVGGPAALFVEATDDDVLAAVAAATIATGLPVLVVGNGSNLLVADAGFPGIAVRLGERYARIEVDGTTVRATTGRRAAPCG